MYPALCPVFAIEDPVFHWRRDILFPPEGSSALSFRNTKKIGYVYFPDPCGGRVTRMNKDTRKEKHSVIASLDLAVNTVII
jgi:hypothetical protein